MATDVSTVSERYLELIRAHPLRPIRSEEDLDRAIAMLDALIDLGMSHRTENEEDYMLVLGTLVMEYEDIHWPMPSDLEEQEVLRRHREAKMAEGDPS
jgi:HTH-type transcriptional regulator/antitoxin HigA